MARGLLFQRYPAGVKRDIATQIDLHNLGRDMLPFDILTNETNHPNAHVIDRHVLEGTGNIKDTIDLALRALLDNPPTRDYTASAFLSVNDADMAIQNAIQGHVAARGGWPGFREHLINTAPDANAMPGTMAAGGTNVQIWRNRRNSKVLDVDLPSYLQTHWFLTKTLSAAAGRRPLYTQDPRPGLSGQPLAVRASPSGNIETFLHPHRTTIGGYWVRTAFPIV